MRTLSLILLLTACGPKKAPEPVAAAEPAPAAAPEPEPTPEPEAEPEPPPEVVNADLNITVSHAGGSAKSGKVKRIERSSDWFGEEGWSTEPKDLKLALEKGNASKDALWTEVKSVAVVPGKVPADADCVYDSNFTPWMYDCTVKTTATVTLKDGTTGWLVTNRHKWRFTYEDGSQEEFWLYKHPAREQDEKVVDLDTTNPENMDLYVKLQERLKSEIKTTMVTKVTIQ